MNATSEKSTASDGGQAGWVELVRQHVRSMHYGKVEIVVHDSRVIQIDKTERVRLEKSQSETHLLHAK